jgi:WASH complex subunit 7, N-terminal
VEHLKAIEYTFIRKDLVIAETQVHTIRTLATAVLQCVQPFHLKLQGNRRLDNARIDLLSSLNVLEAIVKGSDTYSSCRQQVRPNSFCHIALSIPTGSRVEPGIAQDKQTSLCFFCSRLW